MLPAAILLDLDDTIIDFGGSVEASWNQACTEAEAEVPAIDARRLKPAILQAGDAHWSDPELSRISRQDLRAASAFTK